MNDLALRPRTPTELVDAALQVYRRDPIQFIVATAAVYVPWLVLRLVFDLGVTPELPSLQQTMFGVLAIVVAYALVGGVVTVMASDVYLGKPADAVRALRVVLGRIVPLLATGVVTLFLIFIGAILFFLPALYVVARFFAVRQAVVLEGVDAVGALTRSSQLSLGMKRHILNALILVGLVTLAISLGANLLFGLIPSRVVLNVLVTAVQVVLYPVFGITETLLYYDVRIRKEGFDVEYLATMGPALGAEQPDAPL